MTKKFFSVIVFVFSVSFAQFAFGQELLTKVPSGKDEFKASEKNVIATIDWLEKTPFDTEETKRKNQQALFIAWVSDSPTVTIELNADILTFTKKNPELLVTFMGGWTKYSLENNYSKDVVQGSIAGIKSVIRVYKSQSIKKDKEVEKYIALDEKAELESWVKSTLNKK